MRLEDGQIVGAFGFGEAVFALMVVAEVIEDLAEGRAGRLPAMRDDRRGGLDEHAGFFVAFDLQQGFAEVHGRARGGERGRVLVELAGFQAAFEDRDGVVVTFAVVQEDPEVQQGHAQGREVRFDRLVAQVEGILVGRFRDFGAFLLMVAFRQVLQRVDDLRDARFGLPDPDASLEHGQLGAGFLGRGVEQSQFQADRVDLGAVGAEVLLGEGEGL